MFRHALELFISIFYLCENKQTLSLNYTKEKENKFILSNLTANDISELFSV